ncbi:MAG: hypothetical protein IJH34_13395 [Romboutsia sp.]|nr:hypothetical protein [Romboutsia sp.]
MSDVVIISLLLVGICNSILTLYLIYLVKFDKEVSQRALTLIKARYSTEQILEDMSVIISQTTERFEEQTRKVQEQVNRHLQHANITSAKLNTTLTDICNEVSETSKKYGYNPKFKNIDKLDDSSSGKNSINYNDITLHIDDDINLYNEIGNTNVVYEESPSDDMSEIEKIESMLDEGHSIQEIANTLNIKEKKVQVVLNSKKTINL